MSIELDKPRKVKFSLSAIRDMENAFGGRPLGTLLQDLGQVGINALVIALYHGLKHEDPALNPKITERLLESWLEQGNRLGPIYDAVVEALQATGVFRAEDAGNPQTPAPA